MNLHPWWANFGVEITTLDKTIPEPARALVSFVRSGTATGVLFGSLRHSANLGFTAVHLNIEVERPQDLAYPIRAIEPIAVLFPLDGGQPRVFALREDFPYTPHRNWGAQDTPRSLCIDDRPWAEARLTSSSADLIRRIGCWLAKAARGELHDPALPPEPLFFHSGMALVIPPDAISGMANAIELTGFIRSDNNRLVLTYPTSSVRQFANQFPGFVVLGFRAQPQSVDRMKDAPQTLAALADELRPVGIDLIKELINSLQSWAGISGDSLRRLACRVAIIVAFPITLPDGKTSDNLMAFISHSTAGDIGVLLGVLGFNMPQSQGYVRMILPNDSTGGLTEKIEPAQVHLAFSRDLAAVVAGADVADKRDVLMVGAGSIGSQIAVNLAREGKFLWTIVDDDFLLPHNFARHALSPNEIGAPKADALVRQLTEILGEECRAIDCNILNPGEKAEELRKYYGEAKFIIDASASVAVSRYLSDLPDVAARRVCIFFNPAGTAVVLLAESDDREITLRDLEAQYHRLIQSDPRLSNHLTTTQQGLRYSGSCRSLTNRISATKAALLGALVARGISNIADQKDAAVRIWCLEDDGSVDLIERAGSVVHKVKLGDWCIIYDTELLDTLAQLRAVCLPNETGGVLLGIVDTSRKSIHVVTALSQPEDSRGSHTEFERGVIGLTGRVEAAVIRSMHQLRYVGEWHSHPRCASAMPSITDIAQIAWLGREMEIEGLLGLMAIAADNGAFTFVASGAISENLGTDYIESKKGRV